MFCWRNWYSAKAAIEQYNVRADKSAMSAVNRLLPHSLLDHRGSGNACNAFGFDREGSDTVGELDGGSWIGSDGFLVDASMSSSRQVAQMVLASGTVSKGEKIATTH